MKTNRVFVLHKNSGRITSFIDTTMFSQKTQKYLNKHPNTAVSGSETMKCKFLQRRRLIRRTRNEADEFRLRFPYFHMHLSIEENNKKFKYEYGIYMKRLNNLKHLP